MSAPLWSELAVILERVREAEAVLLAMDFDGTLAPIAARPEQAAIPEETLKLLRHLADLDDVSIAILSGRSLEDLKGKLQLDCIYVGNHGLEIEGRGISFVHREAPGLRPMVDSASADLDAALQEVFGVRVERKGLTATIHYRQAPADLADWIENRIRVTVAPYARWLTLKPARKAWEVRPKIDWDKGSALRFVLGRIHSVKPLVMCAGDDITDEDMFDVLPDAISIQVGGRASTAARYHVTGPAELAEFLWKLRSAIVMRTRQSSPLA